MIVKERAREKGGIGYKYGKRVPSQVVLPTEILE